jgi:hypothetical protein
MIIIEIIRIKFKKVNYAGSTIPLGISTGFIGNSAVLFDRLVDSRVRVFGLEFL